MTSHNVLQIVQTDAVDHYQADDNDEHEPGSTKEGADTLDRIAKHLSERASDASKRAMAAEETLALYGQRGPLERERTRLLERVAEIDRLFASFAEDPQRLLILTREQCRALSDASEIVRDYQRLHRRLAFDRRVAAFLERGDTVPLDEYAKTLSELVHDSHASLNGVSEFIDPDIRPRIERFKTARLSQYCLLAPKEGSQIALLVQDAGPMWGFARISFNLSLSKPTVPTATTREFTCVCPGCLMSPHDGRMYWTPDDDHNLLRDEIRATAAAAGVTTLVSECGDHYLRYGKRLTPDDLGGVMLREIRRDEAQIALRNIFAGTSLSSVINIRP